MVTDSFTNSLFLIAKHKVKKLKWVSSTKGILHCDALFSQETDSVDLLPLQLLWFLFNNDTRCLTKIAFNEKDFITDEVVIFVSL